LRSTRCGTPLYSSPEIILEKDYDNKVDIWNIGILVYELLYGKVPFDIRGENDLLKIVDEDICFPKSIPVSCECKDFILKCLNKDSR
jgi:serine/threonine protein kinase